MDRQQRILKKRWRRAHRVRRRVRGDSARPRLTVFRSHKHIYAQIVDDIAGHTLCSSSSRVLSGAYGGTVEHAAQVGEDLAKKATGQNIKTVCFDRGRYRFHGRVQALAEAARKGGLEF